MSVADRKSADNRLLRCPFVVAWDQRESAPWRFTGLLADADKHHRPLLIELERTTLETGDYSIVGMEDRVTLERKSIEDLFGSLAVGRDRFEAEHRRMRNIIDAGGFAAVIVESSLEQCIENPPLWSNLPVKVVYRTCLSWTVRYRVPWFWAPGRRAAEVTAFRLLEKWWEQNKATEGR